MKIQGYKNYKGHEIDIKLVNIHNLSDIIIMFHKIVFLMFHGIIHNILWSMFHVKHEMMFLVLFGNINKKMFHVKRETLCFVIFTKLWLISYKGFLDGIPALRGYLPDIVCFFFMITRLRYKSEFGRLNSI